MLTRDARRTASGRPPPVPCSPPDPLARGDLQRTSGTGDDAGAAVVEFTLVGLLVVALFLGVLQVGVSLHLRNVVTASVAEGAREAANADRGCADGTARAYDLIRGSVGRKVADGLAYDCADVSRDGVALVQVRARGPLPLLFLPVGSVAVDAAAHAIEEGQ